MTKKKDTSDKPELKSLVTSSISRTSKLLSLSLRVGADAAVLSVRGFLSGTQKADLSRKFLIDQAIRLTEELGKLKGSMQKAGQLFSIYGEHFLPPEVAFILKALQKDTPPVTWEIMQATARRTLGHERLKELQINPKPIGTASIGQVYRTSIAGDSGEWCLKLQYPGVDKSIDSDLKILRSIFGVVRFLPKDMNLDGLFEEIRAMLHREVDYLKEADATEKFKDWLRTDQRFVIPKVNRNFTTRRAIMTSYEYGFDVDGIEVSQLSQDRRNRLGEAFLELFFMEFFSFRTVQTDPHFGNYRVRLDPNNTDQWVLLDFGAIRTFPQTFVKQYKAIIEAVIFNADPHGMFKALRSLGIMTDEDDAKDIQAFYEISQLISEPFMTEEPYHWGKTGLAQRVAAKVKSVLFDHGIRRPPEELVFLDRKIGGVFTILQKLDAVISARPMLERYLASTQS